MEGSMISGQAPCVEILKFSSVSLTEGVVLEIIIAGSICRYQRGLIIDHGTVP